MSDSLAASAQTPNTQRSKRTVKPNEPSTNIAPEKTARSHAHNDPRLDFMDRVVSALMTPKYSFPFLRPVDPQIDGCPDYFDIVKNPMDLSTVRHKLDNDEYSNAEECIEDLKLIATNCFLYNKRETYVAKCAQAFEQGLIKKIASIDAESDKNKPVVEPVDKPNLPKSFLQNSGIVTSDTVHKSNKPNKDPSKKNKSDHIKSSKKPDEPSTKEASANDVARDLQKLTQDNANSQPQTITRMQYDFIKQILLRDMMGNRALSFPFLEPVDPIALGVPHYHTIIKKPMDFGTIKKKLGASLGFCQYRNINDFVSDMRLVFGNCYKFNPPDDVITISGKELEKLFEERIIQIPNASVIPSQTYDPDANIPSINSNNNSLDNSMSNLRKRSSTMHLDSGFEEFEDLDHIDVQAQMQKYNYYAKNKNKLKSKKKKYSFPPNFSNGQFAAQGELQQIRSMNEQMREQLNLIQLQITTLTSALAAIQGGTNSSLSASGAPNFAAIAQQNQHTLQKSGIYGFGSNSMLSTPASARNFSSQRFSSAKPVKYATPQYQSKYASPAYKMASLNSAQKSSSLSNVNLQQSADNFDDDNRAMTFQEKKNLSENISQLPDDKLGRVIDILKERVPSLRDSDPDEIELEVDTLDNETLRELERYVQSVLSPAPAESVSQQEANEPAAKANESPESKSSESEISDDDEAPVIASQLKPIDFAFHDEGATVPGEA